MPDHKPPPPATLVDTLPDDVPDYGGALARAAKYTNAWTPTGGFLVLTQSDWPTVVHQNTPAPDCPHRRTTRDASGGIVCDACGEEITRG